MDQNPVLVEETMPVEAPKLKGRRAPVGASRGRLIWLRLRSTPRFWVGLGVILLLILWSALAPVFSDYGINSTDLLNSNTGPSGTHFFGTDNIGHDIYSLTAIGLRKSLIIGLIAGPATTLISAVLGSIAGYVGGKTDAVITWIIQLMLVIPAFFILMIVVPAMKSLSWMALVLLIPLLGWMIIAQTVRSQTLSLKERDFVKAARFMGVGTGTILRRHILPNIASLLIIDATLNVNNAIYTETALSYFGYGIQPPNVSLGTLLADGTPAATTQWWQFVFPALILIILLLAVNLLGEALRDAIDPTSGATRA